MRMGKNNQTGKVLLIFRSFRYCRRPLLIWQGKGNIFKGHLGMIKPVLILSFCYSRPAFRAKLFLIEVGFAARRPYCSIFKLFWPLDIQTFWAARYSKFPFHPIFKFCGLLDIQCFRAALYFHLSGRSIFKLFGLLDIQTFRLLDVLTFQAARYSKVSIFKVFELLDIQTFQAAQYSNFSGCSISKVFGLLDI